MVLDAKPLTAYAEALNKATLEVRENAQPGFTSGLFHQETERGQRIRAEATKPLPTTLAQALDLKRKDLGEGTIQNHERQILLPRKESADSEFVFPQGISKAKAKDYVDSRLRTLATHLGYSKTEKTNAHSYRHAFGGGLSDSCNQEVKQKLLGHSGSLTSHYTSDNMAEPSKAVECVGVNLTFEV